MVSYQGYGTFGKSFNTAKELFALIFFVFGFIVMDEGANTVFEEWTNMNLAKIAEAERKEQEMMDGLVKSSSL
jgi:hypothetical protein